MASSQAEGEETTSIKTAEDLDKAITRIQSRVAQLQTITESPLTHTIPLTHADFAQRPFDPSTPFVTDKDILLQHSWIKGSTAEFVRCIQSIGKEYRRTRQYKVWNHIADESQQIPFMNIINSMYSGMIEGLVQGNLMERYFNDLDFQKAIDIHHPLLKAPGHYVQAYVLRQFVQEAIMTSSPNTQGTQKAYRKQQENAGRQLTGRQLRKTYFNARTYYWADNSYNPRFAKSLDESVQGNGTPRPLSDYQNRIAGAHRFCPTADSALRQSEWLTALWNNAVEKIEKLLQEEIRIGVRNPILDNYLQFILFELGYSTDVKSRADAHSNWRSSNKIFTFWQCLIRFLFDKEDQKYEVKRFMTNRLPRVEHAHGDACTVDVGLTVMAHAHWFEGGMNPDPGAGGGVQKVPLHPDGKHKQLLESNFNWVYRQQGEYQYNLKKDQLKLEAGRQLDLKYEDRETERVKQKEDRAELKRHLEHYNTTAIPNLQEFSKLLKVREQVDRFKEVLSTATTATSPVPDLLTADESSSSQPRSSQVSVSATLQRNPKMKDITRKIKRPPFQGVPALVVVDTEEPPEAEQIDSSTVGSDLVLRRFRS